MRQTLLLAWRYLSYYRGRSLILLTCICLSCLLPLAVNWLVASYKSSLETRAQQTPLVVGAPGSRYDLVLSSLYFKGRVPRPLDMAAVASVQAGGLALPIPLLLGRKAQGYPVVGTSPEYYAFRDLRAAEGTLPLLLGDVVLGAEVAHNLHLGAGDHLLSDQRNLYDLAKGYPLRMLVSGVLAQSHGPDDRAVFVDLKTAWIIDGIGHGHLGAEEQGEEQVMARRDGQIRLNPSVVQYNEITAQNIDSFHFHGDPAGLPVTAILLSPENAKAATLLKGRFRVEKSAQLLVPDDVVAELLGFVFRIKVFFDANVVLVGLATGLFLVLVVMLSLRLRQREMETLYKIGCGRSTVIRLLGTELLLICLAGLGLACLLAALLATWLGSGAGIF